MYRGPAPSLYRLYAWHNVWVGVTLPFFAILSKIGMLAGYGTVFGCIGYYLYERREV